MICSNLNESIECIQKQKINLQKMENNDCSQSCSDKLEKLNIKRIKLLFLNFLKQFNIQELSFVIKFLKYALDKYDSDVIELLEYLITKPEDKTYFEDEISMNSLNSFKKKFFKTPTTLDMPKIVRVDSMSNLKSPLKSEFLAKNVNKNNNANASTSITCEKLNVSDQIFIESSPEQQKEKSKRTFSNEINEINESFEFLQNHTFYDQDEQDVNSYDCFHSQHEKSNNNSSFYCYKEEISSEDEGDLSGSLDNDDKNNQSDLDNYDSDQEVYQSKNKPATDILAVEQPRKITDSFGNLINQQSSKDYSKPSIQSPQKSNSQTKDSVFKSDQSVDSESKENNGNMFEKRTNGSNKKKANKGEEPIEQLESSYLERFSLRRKSLLEKKQKLQLEEEAKQLKINKLKYKRVIDLTIDPPLSKRRRLKTKRKYTKRKKNLK